MFNRLRAVRTDRLLTVQAFLGEAMVIYPFYAIMFTERGGLSLAEVNILLALWIASAMIFEIPTGIIADRYSRKATVVAAGILTACAFIVWIFSGGFVGYALGFLVWGIGWTLRSGAYQALIYDELARDNRQAEYTKVWSRIKAAEFAGMLVAFSGAYLLSINGVNYSLLLVVSTVVTLLSVLLLLAIPTAKKQQTDPTEHYIDTLRDAALLVRQRVELRHIVIWTALFSGVIGWYEEYTPLFDVLIGVLPRYVPLIMVGVVVVNMIASLIAPRFEPQSTHYRIALPLIAAAMITFATAGLWLPFAIIMGHGGLLLMRMGSIYLTSDLQHAASDNVRATVASLGEFFGYFVAIAVALSAATLSYVFAGLLPFRYTAIVIAVVAVLSWIVTRRRSGKPGSI